MSVAKDPNLIRRVSAFVLVLVYVGTSKQIQTAIWPVRQLDAFEHVTSLDGQILEVETGRGRGSDPVP
jgi:hypothetical protein